MMSADVPKQVRPWKLLGRQVLFSAEPWLTLYKEQVELPSGRVIDDFYRVVMPDFAVVVPVTEAGEFIMVRGYKHGLERVILSPPAGLVGPGEVPLDAARRELLEETGYESEDWQSLGKFVVDGNRQCGTMHLFLARGVIRTRLPEKDDAEELAVEVLDRERLLGALAVGEIGNLAGSSAVALALVLGEHEAATCPPRQEGGGNGR